MRPIVWRLARRLLISAAAGAAICVAMTAVLIALPMTGNSSDYCHIHDPVRDAEASVDRWFGRARAATTTHSSTYAWQLVRPFPKRNGDLAPWMIDLRGIDDLDVALGCSGFGWPLIWLSASSAKSMLDGRVYRADPATATAFGRQFILPTRIGWPSLAANTAILGAPVFLALCVSPLVASWRRRRRGLCPRCGYALVGLAANRCPECGRQLDHIASPEPDRPGTQRESHA